MPALKKHRRPRGSSMGAPKAPGPLRAAEYLLIALVVLALCASGALLAWVLASQP